jgi:hypothetical protein
MAEPDVTASALCSCKRTLFVVEDLPTVDAFLWVKFAVLALMPFEGISVSHGGRFFLFDSRSCPNRTASILASPLRDHFSSARARTPVLLSIGGGRSTVLCSLRSHRRVLKRRVQFLSSAFRRLKLSRIVGQFPPPRQPPQNSWKLKLL